jgi:hypothetical protein
VASPNRPFETVPFKTLDGVDLNFKHLKPAPGRREKGPVIMVSGAGVRADLFCPPTKRTLPAMLSDDGFDVWLLNWRSSIDLPAIEYTLDDAAVNDMPAAIAKIRAETGADKVKAVTHCQGSCAFMMAITAGLLPDVSSVVANSCALHPIIPRPAWFKLPLAVNTLGLFVKYFNPQWGLHAPGFWPKAIDLGVRVTHHECDNPVCKHASFTYGLGFPTMWDHENLDDATHEWIKGEFAHVPMSLFRQIANSIAAGELVSTGRYPNELPPLFTTQPPQTNARFVFMTGDRNRTFSPEAMARTFEFFERFAPGKHIFQKVAGYGHLDMFFGRNAHRDVFPFIIDQLNKPARRRK